MSTYKEYPRAFTLERIQSVSYIAPTASPVDLRTGLACPNPTTIETAVVKRWTDSVAGVSNPYYKSQIIKAENATTPLTGSRRNVVIQGGRLEAQSNYNTKYWCQSKESLSGAILPAPEFHLPVAPPNHEDAKRLAYTKFVKKAREKMTPFSGGIFLGEITRTLHMIRNPALALRRSLDAYFSELKKIQKRYSNYSPSRADEKRRRLRRALAGTYLEYNFGWQQLMRDIHDAGVSLNNIRPFAVEKINASGYSQAYGNGDVAAISGGGHQVLYRHTTCIEDSVHLKGGVRTSASVPSVSESFGLNYPNFFPTAWELIPWSFFIDYFTNVGEVIAAATQVNSGLSWCCMTEKVKYETWCEIREVKLLNPNTYIALDSNPGAASLEDIDIQRSSISSVIPSLGWELPGLKSWFNIAALALQGSIKRPFF